jgi:two-component system sensor histidine kinase KdpD
LTDLVMLYLLGVIFVASRAGRGPALATALLSVAAFDFFFIPPRFTFAVSDVQHLITFVGFLIVAFATSTFAAQARDQARAAQHRQAQTAALFDLSRDLAATGSLSSILDTICNFALTTFPVRVAILLPDGDRLRLVTWGPSTEDNPIDDDELAVADWVFHHAQAAGLGTNTLPAAEGIYLPLKTAQGTVGVLGVTPVQPDQTLTPEQRRLLEASAVWPPWRLSVRSFPTRRAARAGSRNRKAPECAARFDFT